MGGLSDCIFDNWTKKIDIRKYHALSLVYHVASFQFINKSERSELFTYNLNSTGKRGGGSHHVHCVRLRLR